MFYALPVTPPSEGGINIIYLIGHGVNKKILPFFKAKTSYALSRSSHPALRDGIRACLPARQGRPINKSPIHRMERKLYLGHFQDKGKIIDEIIITLIPSKHSFSGLDTIEINSHGSVLVADKIISTLKRNGIKIITTPQLLKLALKNKRINAVQKGALESLLNAKTELACRFFLQRLAKPGKQTPESARLEKLFNNPRRIVLVGKANSGKSTLFNVLVGEKRVIEHPTPGTTRDVVEDAIAIKGIPFVLADTAGWMACTPKKGKRNEQALGFCHSDHDACRGKNPVQRKLFRKDDIIIYLLDGSKRLEKAEETVMKGIAKWVAIWAINKSDLPCRLEANKLELTALKISALKKIGIDKLSQKILTVAKS